MRFRGTVLNTLPGLVKELGVLFKDLSLEDNFSSYKIEDLALPANTETKIRNGLDHLLTKYLIVKQTGNALITAGDTVWTNDFLYLKNHDASNSATISTILLYSYVQMPLTSFIHSGFRFGTFPITGVPHAIDSSGKVPKPDISSTQTETNESLRCSENSFYVNPLISRNVIQRYCGYFR